jgi:methyl-accepting chemotaxis protein
MASLNLDRAVPQAASRAPTTPQLGRAATVWAVIGLLSMVSAIGLGAWANNKTTQALRSQAAAATLSAQLARAPQLIASNPSGIQQSLQSSVSSMPAGSLPQPAQLAVDEVSRQAQILAPQSAALTVLAAQEQQFSQALSDMPQAVAGVRTQPTLVSGQWGQALAPSLSEYSRPEISAMGNTFYPAESSSSIQKQWAARFVAIDTDLLKLVPIAHRDSTLNAAARAALDTLSASSHALAQSSTDLASQAALRIAADKAKKSVAKVAGPGADAVQSMSMPSPDAAKWASWTGWALQALTAFSLLMLLLAYIRAKRIVHDVSEDSRLSSINVDSIERLMRQIQKIAPGDGAIFTGIRVEESANSPYFGVAAAFNRMVDSLASQQRRLREAGADMEYAATPAIEGATELSAAQQRVRLQWSEAEQSALGQARTAAGAAQRAQQLSQDSRVIQDSARRTSAMLQERGFRMDALRENNQDIAKRLKRLGESSQGIALAADRIHGISQQIKVLAINVAIFAASAGEEGRVFTSIATELQRLALGGNDAALEIDSIVELLLNDAAEVASTMESGTSEVVESGRLSEKAELAVKEIERLSQPITGELSRLVGDMEAHALSLAEGASKWQASSKDVERGSTVLVKMQEALANLRSQSRVMGKETE